MEKPIFNKRIFWDVVSRISIMKLKPILCLSVCLSVVTCQISEIASDIMDKVTEALLNAKFLPEGTMYLASAAIDRPLTDFRC